MLMAEVCIDCGRKHYRLEAETGRYFADIKRPRINREEWHGNN